MDIPLLKDVVIIFTLSVGVLLLCHKLKIPSIVGFLITGIVSGPHGLGLVAEADNVETLAEIGIVFLLFTVGMEFSLKRLMELKRYFFLGGLIQVALTVFFGFLVGVILGNPLGESLFLGFLISLSSTAITLRVLDHRGEMDSPQGNLVVGILIFQDIIAIPMMLMAPLLVGGESVWDISFVATFFKGIFMLVVIFLVAEFVVPRVLYYITRTRNQELFLLGILAIGFSVGYFTSSLGLSLALGAFLAGLVISESEYTTEAVHHILPFEEVFLSLFFISTGMLLDVRFLLNYAPLVIGVALGIIVLKTLTGTLSAILLRMPLHHAIVSGLALCQIGEFSFVLTKAGKEVGIGSEFHHQLILAVVLLTMGLTPFIINSAHSIADWVNKFPWPHQLKVGRHSHHVTKADLHKEHLILIGFGWCGRQIAALAEEVNVSTLIIEMNSETVKVERAKGRSIHYGDASHEVILKHAHIQYAQAVVIVINDPLAVIRIVKAIKSLRGDLPVIARVRYISQMEYLLKMGVNHVVCDELSSSKELLIRTFDQFNVKNRETINRILSQTESHVIPKSVPIYSILV